MDSTDTAITRTVTALQIRAGDVFTRHRKTWTAAHNANRCGQFSAAVETTNGGIVYFPVALEVTVIRDTKGFRCDDRATA
ncbi:hypothetical protein ACFWFX_15425 [Streptomyces roseolus]|uniref:hypothetical protein n=1 Tax=Streptomyces roseolus TaxID=67358 RepID=UPI00364ACE05